MFLMAEILARPLAQVFVGYDQGLMDLTLRAFLRSLVFQVAAVLILPLLLGIDGIWLSIVAAELVAAVVALLFMVGLRKKYQY